MDCLQFFLAYFPLIVLSSGQSPCCWYKQWEGSIAQKYGVYDRIGNYASIADIQGRIHVDYDRLMTVNELVITNSSNVYTLTSIDDFNKKIAYTIVSGLCIKSNLTVPLQDNCVPEKAVLLGSHNHLGIEADTWILPYYNTSMTYTWRVTVSRKQCIPLQEVILTIADTSNLSFMTMTNITQGIVDPNIFNIPPICQTAAIQKAEVPRMNVVGLHSVVKPKFF